MQQTGVYIHIPFCVRKCNYCDFLSFAADTDIKQRYTDALCQEIRRAEVSYPENRNVDTIFFGGGTPSLLTNQQLEQIMHALNVSFCLSKGAEISMECNPGTVSQEDLHHYRNLGINRISFGVQSFQDTELQLLGRVHTSKQAVECFEWARKAGFQNINMDLMSGIPGQTMESYQHTLEEMCRLAPEHISAYSLIVEEGTPFYETYAENMPVTEEDDRAMYEMTRSILKEFGYGRYEISNYARQGYECKHNLKYWSGEDYIGMGLGASGKIGRYRYKNESKLTLYMDKINCNQRVTYVEEELSMEDEMAEFFILGLRKMQGVSLAEFYHRFSKDSMDIYGNVISYMKDIDLLKQNGDWLSLTSKGIDVSNQVLCEFL